MKKELDFGVHFHQTFPPTPNYIGRILAIADGQKRSSREVSDLTGIPQGESSGKVVPHLKYAAYMGLIEPDVSAPQLTPLGQLVLDEDRGCSEDLTQWLLHSRLCSAAGAPMWRFFVRDLLRQNRGNLSKEYLSSQMQARFGTVKYTPVLTTYQELSGINYLSTDRITGAISLNSQRVHREYLYLYGYDLLSEWAYLFPGQNEITSIEMGVLASASCFALTETQWFEVLEQLSSVGICRINKQLTPFTVIRMASTQSAEENLYSLLI